MEGSQFDLLTRSLVAATTRRRTLRGVARATLAAVLGGVGLEEAAAELPKKCKQSAQCGPGAKCVGAKDGKPGKCKCRAGQTNCPGTKGCLDTLSDSNNCSGCGNVCPAGQTCRGGACTCGTGQFECDEQPQHICCQQEQACLGDACGACPESPDPCVSSAQCGYSGAPQPRCYCVTSVEGATTCTSVFANPNQPFECTSDAQCTAHLGVEAVCVYSPCFDLGVDHVCLNTGCIDLSFTSGARSGGHRLRQVGLRSAK